jgi:hypothetical protein
MLMEKPGELGDFLAKNRAVDSSNREFLPTLSQRDRFVCHDLPGEEIPDRSFVYRIMKRSCFFGFGAYG